MRVRMLKTAANNDGVFNEGKEYDLAPELAKMWVARGAAVALEPLVETAAVERQSEQAVSARGRPRKV